MESDCRIQRHLCQLTLKHHCHRVLLIGFTASDKEDKCPIVSEHTMLREVLNRAGQRRTKVAEVGGEGASCSDGLCLVFSL